jgi:hypothetical protein
VAQVQATIENVPQNPGTAFTVSGNTITFDGAPPSGTNNIYVYYTSPITQVIQPGQGTVGAAQLQSGLATQWTTSGSNIYYNTGSVGVGTTSPTAQLQLNRSGTGDYTSFRLSNSGASGRTYEIGLGGNTAAAGYANTLYFYDSTAGAIRMGIDSSGRVTTPSQPAFNANNSGNFTISSETSITYNTAQWNTGSNYSTATGRFTAPVAGYYLIFHKLASNTTNVFEPKIYINGTEVARAYSPNTSSNGKTITVSTIWYMSASDYAQPYAYVPGSTTFYGSGSVQSSFYGYLLG